HSRAPERPDRATRLRVEARRRLVEDRRLGPPDDAERDVEPAALAAGELARARAGLLAQPDGVDHLVGVARSRVERREVPHELGDRELGLVARVLQHDAEARAPGPSCGLRVLAEHAVLARVAVAEPLEDLDGRRLAGAVRAEDREDLAALDPQVDAVHGALGAVALAQAADVHGRSAGPGTGAAGAGGRVCRRHATSVPRRARRPRRPFVRTSRPPIGWTVVRPGAARRVQ